MSEKQYQSALMDAVTNPEYSVINRQKSVLPEYLFALGASAYNEDAFAVLDSLVPASGKLEGQSKRNPEDDMAEPTVTEYLRPNGEVYYSRTWTNRPDVEVLRACRQHMKFPYFYGAPGTGKTALAEAAFGTDLLTIVVNGDTEVSDFVGQWLPDATGQSKTGYIWDDGPLLTAMREGRPLLVDEIGLADAKVLSVLYSAMDGRREINVTANPEIGTVRAADGFMIIAATNPNAPGVNMSEALLSRLGVQVEITTDYELAISKLDVPENVVAVSIILSKSLRDNKCEWAPQMRELIEFRDLKKIFDEEWAVSNLIACAPEEDREYVSSIMARSFGATVSVRARI